MGLSVDDRMGSDSAIECVKKNDEVEAFISVTRAVPNNYGARRSEIVSGLVLANLLIKFKFKFRIKPAFG